MTSPYDKRKEGRKIGVAGMKSERNLARRLGGRLTAASGALDGFKGDIQKGNFLIEAKSTINDSLGLKLDWLLKIKKEARAVKKRPALAINFTTRDGRTVPDGEWVAIPLALFEELLGDEE